MLITEKSAPLLFHLIAKFIALDSKKASEKLNKLPFKLKEDKMLIEDYLHPIIFSSESQGKNDGIKKKYNKLNTLCK